MQFSPNPSRWSCKFDLNQGRMVIMTHFFWHEVNSHAVQEAVRWSEIRVIEHNLLKKAIARTKVGSMIRILGIHTESAKGKPNIKMAFTCDSPLHSSKSPCGCILRCSTLLSTGAPCTFGSWFLCGSLNLDSEACQPHQQPRLRSVPSLLFPPTSSRALCVHPESRPSERACGRGP